MKNKRVRQSTARNYLAIWRHFNKFIIKLDRKPKSWEERTALFCAHLIHEKGAQSQTIKSYKSAIKATLSDDGYEWDESKLLFNSLVRACKLQNDHICCRLPIKKGLLEIILFELNRVVGNSQIYLQVLYRALFCLAFYGLMRIGELAEGSHALKAANIHVGQNKNKILIVLYSSKTHGKESYPQKIKISAKNNSNINTVFCPFETVRLFMKLRGSYEDEDENLFIFKDKRNVTAPQVRTVLRTCLDNVGLQSELYDCHSFRIGKASSMWDENYTLEQIKRAGRWRSNAIYRYLRD